MIEVDWERATAEALYTADKKGLSTKIKVLTEQADKAILDNITATWAKPTTDLENHIDGLAPLSKGKKDAEHYRDGKHPEDDYYVESEADKLVKNSKEAQD